MLSLAPNVTLYKSSVSHTADLLSHFNIKPVTFISENCICSLITCHKINNDKFVPKILFQLLNVKCKPGSLEMLSN